MMVRHVIAGNFKRTCMGAMARMAIDELQIPWERRLAAEAGRRDLTIDIGPDGIAVFSECDRWRYLLTRTWDKISPPRIATWIMCNPSTADAFVLDPTIRRCVAFSKREGCTALIVVNVYAWRSTDPKALNGNREAFGRHNATHIRQALREADVAIAAWGSFRASGSDGTSWSAYLPGSGGAHGVVKAIASEVGKPLHALRVTRGGDPGHPLYVPAAAPLELYCPRGPAVYFTTEAR